MKKEEVIQKYLEEYLQGKDEAARENFLSKGIDRQYGNIMAWKRRHLTKASRESVTAEQLLDEIKVAVLHVRNLQEMTEKEAAKLLHQTELLKEAIKTFDDMQKERKLAELRARRAELDALISEMEK